MKAEARSEALTTAIAAGLAGLPAPAVDAPPGPTGPPEDRGFARALHRAAPPSEASPTQGSPPPKTAVAEHTSDASHEAGTAASTQQDTAFASIDAAAEDEPSSLPDRPAGVVEETHDADVPGPGTLEAMMAALFTRPAAPAPDAVEFTSAVPGGAALASTLQETALATAGIAMVENPSGIGAEAPTTDAAADAAIEAMRLAAQAGQASAALAATAAHEAKRLASSRGAEVGVADAGATLAFEAETPTVTMGTDQGGVSRRAPASASTETASTPLGLLEGMNDVEAVELTAARGSAQPSTRSAGEAEDDGLAAMRAAVNGASMATTRDGADVASTSAAKANALHTVPVTTQVAETVRAAVMRGDHEIRLVLNPGDLGQITVRIVEQGGALHLRLDATKAATHDLLARELPGLRQALETRDLRVERIQVAHSGSSSADGSGAAWQQGSSREGQQQDRDGSPAWSPVAALDGPRHHLEGRRAPRLIRHEAPRHLGVLDRVA